MTPKDWRCTLRARRVYLVMLSSVMVLQGCASIERDTHTDPKAQVDQGALPSPATPFDSPYRSVADYLACLRGADIMLVTGHRGGPTSGFPENAIETFANTLAYGPMLIEADVRMTADGVFILMHDETLDRTTTGSGPVAAASLEDIQRLTLIDNDGTVTPYRIPTLEDALAWAGGRAILQLDVKAGAPIEDVAAFIKQSNAQGFAAVIAYTTEDANAARLADPDVTVSVEITDLEILETLLDDGFQPNRLMALDRDSIRATRPMGRSK